MRSRFLVAGLMLAGAVSGVAQADSREDWKRKPPGRFRVGPFWVTPRLELRNAGVETNVYNELADPTADTSVVLRPGLRVALPLGRRVRLQGTGSVDFNYFRRESDERSTDFGGHGAAAVDVGRLTFSAGGGGGQNRQRPTIDLEERLLRQERFAFGGVDLRLGRATEIRARADASEVRHEPSRRTGADLQRALDRNSRIGRGEVRYDLTALTTLSASAEVIEDTFVHEPGPARLTRSYRYLGGFDFAEKALLTGSARIGVRQIPGSSAGSVPRFTGTAWKVAAVARLRSFGLLRLTSDRDVFYAARAAADPGDRLRNGYVSHRSEVGLDLDLPLRLATRLSASVQRAEYLAPVAVNAGLARRVDILYAPQAALLRSLGDTVRLGLSVGWTRRVSNIPGVSYEGWRYGLAGEITP